jgi:hypothetical protein
VWLPTPDQAAAQRPEPAAASSGESAANGHRGDDRPAQASVPGWGARKIREKLRQQFMGPDLPAISTLHAVLDRQGLCNGGAAVGARRQAPRCRGRPIRTRSVAAYPGREVTRTLALRATAKRLSPIQRIVCYSSSPAAPTDSFPVTFVVMMVVTTVETTEVTLDLIFLGMRA